MTENSVFKKTTSFLVVLILFIGVLSSFAHKFFSEENPKIQNLNKERSELKKEWNKKELDHDQLFINNKINKTEYFIIKKENKLDRAKSFRNIAKKRKELAYGFSFNGRSSFSFWLWIFGVFLTLFIVSCFLSFKDSRLKKEGLLQWYEPSFTISFIFISLFWLYQTVFASTRDFPITIYTLYLVAVLFPLSFFLYHFLRKVFSHEEKLLENIRHLVNHTLNHTEKEKEEEKWEVLEKIANNG